MTLRPPPPQIIIHWTKTVHRGKNLMAPLDSADHFTYMGCKNWQKVTYFKDLGFQALVLKPVLGTFFNFRPNFNPLPGTVGSRWFLCELIYDSSTMYKFFVEIGPVVFEKINAFVEKTMDYSPRFFEVDFQLLFRNRF